MDRSSKRAIAGILVVTLLTLAELILDRVNKIVPPPLSKIIERPVYRATFMAFGDINLGRMIGQRILKGDIDFPFQKINLSEDSADIIFANLESQLSDQNGETVNKKSNIVFTGPPEGAQSLRNAGITVVSTANNHALDYGNSALRETIDLLRSENIFHVGTSKSLKNLYQPLIIEKNNIKFAIFAVTSFVNFNPKRWMETVAATDTVRLKEEIDKVRESVDIIVLSYHGGVEYTLRPVEPTRRFADWCIKNGVDLFIGHHPHVSFGVQKRSDKFIVHSLGNFVFFQPQHYWTQRSYGIKFWFEKQDSSVAFGIEKFIPLKVGLQTERLIDTTEIKKLRYRTQQLSNFDLSTYWN
ncbi:MAG: CapA family protein [Bacteroidota bacterium]